MNRVVTITNKRNSSPKTSNRPLKRQFLHKNRANKTLHSGALGENKQFNRTRKVLFWETICYLNKKTNPTHTFFFFFKTAKRQNFDSFARYALANLLHTVSEHPFLFCAVKKRIKNRIFWKFALLEREERARMNKLWGNDKEICRY